MARLGKAPLSGDPVLRAMQSHQRVLSETTGFILMLPLAEKWMGWGQGAQFGSCCHCDKRRTVRTRAAPCRPQRWLLVLRDAFTGPGLLLCLDVPRETRGAFGKSECGGTGRGLRP